MHEFHAWIGLAESAEESDLGGLAEAVGELEELAADSKWHDAVFEVRNLNGQYFLRADGMVNRRREEGERLDLFLAVIARRLPGSWGLVYERDDEMPYPPGPNAFRVRVLARGSVVERPDPFLSPVHPVIEDLPCSLYFAPRSPTFYARPVKSGLKQAQGNRHRNREAQALNSELPAGLRVNPPMWRGWVLRCGWRAGRASWSGASPSAYPRVPYDTDRAPAKRCRARATPGQRVQAAADRRG